MANSSRRYIDSNGNQFMPMNAEGGAWSENFINTKKLIFIGTILFALIFIILHLNEAHPGFQKAIVLLAIWFVYSVYVLRFIVFEEKFYYKMYKVLKDHEITTPAIFWNIASIRDTSDGAILTYSDTKVGIIVKLERDTITGKHKDFKEVHYDAVSDFYREIMQYKYNFVQFNIMEKAGNDPRLENLDPLIHKSSNANINKLMEKEIGYIKSITYNTLYESDYILIYTGEIAKVDSIIGDVIECIYKILDGAYIGYRILSSREIVEFVKELYGIKYFNYTQATLDMQKLSGAPIVKAFDLTGIQFEDGKIVELEKDQINKINRLTSDVLNGAVNIRDISIKKTLERKKSSNFNGIDIDKIEQGEFYIRGNNQGNTRRAPVRKPPTNRNVQNNQNRNRGNIALDKQADFDSFDDSLQDDNGFNNQPYHDEQYGGYNGGPYDDIDQDDEYI